MIRTMCEKLRLGLRGTENASISAVVLLSRILERLSNASIPLVSRRVSPRSLGMESPVESVPLEEVVPAILEGVLPPIVAGVPLPPLYFVSVSTST